MTDYLAELNEEQRAAVTFPLDRPLKVVAGAGTGKTRVLTTRYVHILAQDPACGPENILALTFTDKAANEMKQRIGALCRQVGVAAGPLALQEAWIGTFHACCHRILRGQALAAGLDPEFTVYDEAQSRLLYQQVVREFLAGQEQVPAGFAVTDLNFYERDIYYLICRLKDNLIYPDDFPSAAARAGQDYYDRWWQLLDALGGLPLHGATKKALGRRGEEALEQVAWEEALIQVVAALFSAYQEALVAANALDFADLIYYTHRLLKEREDLRQGWRRKFRYILVDEFQDTNRAQFALLQLLARDGQMSNVTVVGDEKQAIYGWRNARVENIREFAARDWGGGEVRLTTNYRSYQEILDLAHFAIGRDPYFAGQEGLQLRAHRGSAPGPCVSLYLAPDQEEEGERVAAAIGELLEQGVPPRDIVILLRSPRRARPYEDALRRRGIPYQTVGGVGFYDREEIKDLLAYLRSVTNPYDNLALVRALQAPPCLMSDADLAQISRLQEGEGWGGEKRVYLYDALKGAVAETRLPAALREKLKDFLALWEELAGLRDQLPLPAFLDRILEATGYLDHVYAKPPGEVRRRVANIKKLFALAARLAGETATVDLDEFIDYTTFFLDQDLREGEGVAAGEDAVAIMSVHQAKGLEFPYVFLPNLTDTSFPVWPRYPNLDYDEELGLVSKEDQQGRTTAKYDPYNYNKDNYRELYNRFGIASFKDRQREEQRQEERRLFYVALTRAQEGLYLSCPRPFPERPRGPHFFRELWEGLGAPPWLRRIEAGEEDREGPASAVAARTDWGQAELEEYSRQLFNWYRQRRSLPPAREGLEPISLSASRVEAYRRCGRHYYLQYQLRLPPEREEAPAPALNYDPVLLGDLVHQVLEAYHREGWRPEGAGELLAREARSLGLDRVEHGECLAMAEEILQKYLTGPLANLQPDPAHLERSFSIFLEGDGVAVELAGVIDRIDRDEEGRWLVVDYKTNRSISPAQWEEYCLQLRLYALAFQELYPDRGIPFLYIYHLTEGKLLPVACQPHRLEAAKRTVLETAAAIQAGLFPARSGTHCQWCGYQKYCDRCGDE